MAVEAIQAAMVLVAADTPPAAAATAVAATVTVAAEATAAEATAAEAAIAVVEATASSRGVLGVLLAGCLRQFIQKGSEVALSIRRNTTGKLDPHADARMG